MAHKTKIGGTAYEIDGGRTLVGGTGYSIDKGRAKVDGTGYDVSFGTPIGSLAVGTSVYFNYEGSQEEFIVVHQGNPDSTIYDASCDGTWLLQKEVYFRDAWDYSNNDYKNSFVHECLNDTILSFFDSDIQSAIKSVKIPYTDGDGKSGSVKTGSNGLGTKIFLLSFTEIGGVKGNHWVKVEGAVLDYFNGATDADRICYSEGKAAPWWLRSPYTYDTSGAFIVAMSGAISPLNGTYDYYYRPAFILPSDFDVTNYLS